LPNNKKSNPAKSAYVGIVWEEIEEMFDGKKESTTRSILCEIECYGYLELQELEIVKTEVLNHASKECPTYLDSSGMR
jgi:hypothetical protein